MATKVITVGLDPEVREWFSQVRPDWNLQPNAPTIDDMWSGLEQKTLSGDSRVVVISDQLAENDLENEFGVVVATFGRVATVFVLSYDPMVRRTLSRKVEEARNLYEYTENRFYIVPVGETDTEDPVERIEFGLTDFAGWYKEDVLPEEQFDDQKRGLVISSTSSKGGSGKTTVALLVATMLRQGSLASVRAGIEERPLSVCVVDLDIFDGQIGLVIGALQPTALNIATANDYSEDFVRKNLLHETRMDINALLAPKRVSAARYITPQQYQLMINRLATMFDVVILDTSVRFLDELLRDVAMPTSDAIMFVTNLGVNSIYGMSRWMDEMATPSKKSAPVDKDKIGVVVNQSMTGVGADRNLIQQAAKGASLLVAIPHDAQAVVSAMNHHNLSGLLRNHADISAAYFALAKKLIGSTGYKLSPVYESESSSASRAGSGAPTPAPAPARPAAASTPSTPANAAPATKQRNRLFGGRR